VKYLLDVSALVAMFHTNHPHHARFHAWFARLSPGDAASCAISDLGFIRISMSGYGHDLTRAETALAAMKKRDVTGYIGALPAPSLARWVLSHRQTTDAYLCQLATANGMMLATFDSGIKDAAAWLI